MSGLPHRRANAAGRLALAVLGTLAGCSFSPVRSQCPTCTVVSRREPPRALPAGTRTLFVLVPGLLGWGWEWDAPVERVRRVPHSAMEAFEWSNSNSPRVIARDLAAFVNARLVEPGLERVVIVGHSAAGLFTSLAAADLRVPEGRSVFIGNVGSPYAGMHTTPLDYPEEAWGAPIGIAVGGTFAHYPPPAPRVSMESWVTPWPGDPVMQPRFGHDPGDPRVGPPGPRHVAPPGTDHNRYLATVVEEIAARETEALAARANFLDRASN